LSVEPLIALIVADLNFLSAKISEISGSLSLTADGVSFKRRQKSLTADFADSR